MRRVVRDRQIGLSFQEAEVDTCFELANTLWRDIRIPSRCACVQAADAVQRRSLNGGGAKVGECRRRENVLRGVERRLLSALAVSQSRLAEAAHSFRNDEVIREA